MYILKLIFSVSCNGTEKMFNIFVIYTESYLVEVSISWLNRSVQGKCPCCFSWSIYPQGCGKLIMSTVKL